MAHWRMIAHCIAWSAFAAVQAQGPVLPHFYPEELRQDLETIRLTLHQSHPDPYRYHSRTELDREFEQASQALARPLTAEEFIAAAQPVLRLLGDSHTELDPPAALAEAYAHDEPLLPLKVAVIDNALYVDEELKGFRSVPSGSRIVAVNGRPAEAILATLRSGVFADGHDTTLLDRRVERDLPVLYRRLVERAEAFDLEFVRPDGARGRERLFALTGDEIARSYVPKGMDLRPWRAEAIPEIGVTWLTLSTLDNEVLANNGIPAARFLDELQDEMMRDGTSTLVIDVRGAGGIDLGMAEQVFALIAQQPFRVIQNMTVRSARVPDSYKYAAPAEEFYAAVGSNYLPDLDGRMTLRPDDQRLERLAPDPQAYAGKVYVVCDGLTREAGAAFVMLAKRSGRARVVGEETGANALSFCGGRRLDITLPRTGCVLHVPLTRFVPDGKASGPDDRGELPHHVVTQRAWGLVKGRDTVREALLEVIRELR